MLTVIIIFIITFLYVLVGPAMLGFEIFIRSKRLNEIRDYYRLVTISIVVMSSILFTYLVVFDMSFILVILGIIIMLAISCLIRYPIVIMEIGCLIMIYGVLGTVYNKILSII